MQKSRWIWLPFAQVPIALFAPASYGATYLTAEQAQQAIFPGEKLSQSFITLTKARMSSITLKKTITCSGLLWTMFVYVLRKKCTAYR